MLNGAKPYIIDCYTATEHSTSHHSTLATDGETVVYREEEWTGRSPFRNEEMLGQNLYGKEQSLSSQ